MAQTGHQVHTAASRGGSPHVALLVETSLGSGRDILRGIARYVREHEPWSLYHQPRSLEENFPAWLKSWHGDGIIVRVQNAKMARAVAATRLPVVDVLGVVGDAGLPLVHVDDQSIAHMAAEHLIERGFHRFGFFGLKGENWSERRRDAFCSVPEVGAAGVSCYELTRHAAPGSSWEAQEDELAAWVRGLAKPVGVMVSSDQLGSQFLEACRRASVRVPDDVAVVGVDNDQTLCEVCNPPLSSVNAGHEVVGYQAAALLDCLMRGGSPPRHAILIQAHGVTVRKSSDALATQDQSVATALRLIRNHACQGVTAADVIAQIPVSRSVLQRRFRRELGASIHTEIIKARLNRARDLLAQTELPLIEVAERSGFKHQEYFGAIFKAKTGKTPAQYRREASLTQAGPSLRVSR